MLALVCCIRKLLLGVGRLSFVHLSDHGWRAHRRTFKLLVPHLFLEMLVSLVLHIFEE